ncbi:late secretory pathway protein avl9 [Tulasnella sp. 424]|nr:late secretory pathway protein avl9 [Tulasnella sp. 424]KAG8973395.1 late secretory pathway protein avl9 [Tulasnella sp. 425]
MAHNELLEALRLQEQDKQETPRRKSLEDSDNDDLDNRRNSMSSTRSIPLNDAKDDRPQSFSQFAARQASPPFAARDSFTQALRSPDTTDTEMGRTTTNDFYSPPPTTRTSFSSVVPSLSLAHQEEEKGVKPTAQPFIDEDDSEAPLPDAMTSTITPVASSSTPSRAPSPPLQPSPGTTPQLNRASTASSTSSLGKKVRPDSLIVKPDGPLILGIALVDFNHSVGPRVEMAHPASLLDDKELCTILPFLALPDGAHQSAEDYAYFHLTLENGPVTSGSHPDTVFGISCNKQIAACDLIEKDADVSRSTVQKAVIVLASKPLFGLIRDRLCVVTNALFNQRDFRDTHILIDFATTLENSIKTQLTESGMYMGTSLRELIHKFRQRTLVLLKMLMLQRKIMFFGHPVERLCTYQYSLVSLIPNLLLTLEDTASPNLDRRSKDTSKPTELRTSDRNSLMRYLGLPLNIFGKDSFFQPYLPLQQVDMLKTQSWLCGTTNTIVTQQRDSLPDVLINIETNTFEFKDPKVERLVTLTPADRKWMDDIVRDVNDGWNDSDPSRPLTMEFKGSDDYLRAKFEDYVCSALASVKYADYLLQTGKTDLSAVGSTGDENCVENFGEPWIAAFRQTHAYTVWNQQTDPALFDICEPRHPCESNPTVISDIGLRLAEGLHELKVAETVAPAREAISNAISVGSSGLFRAFEGVRSEVAARLARQQTASSGVATPSPTLDPPKTPEVPSERSVSPGTASRTSYPPQPVTPSEAPATSTPSASTPRRGIRPLSLAPSASTAATAASAASVATETAATAGAAAKATISSWGSFLAKKAAEYNKKGAGAPAPPPTPDTSATAVVPPTPPPGSTPRTPTAYRSPPLGFKGALWTFGERAEQADKDTKPST